MKVVNGIILLTYFMWCDDACVGETQSTDYYVDSV